MSHSAHRAPATARRRPVAVGALAAALLVLVAVGAVVHQATARPTLRTVAAGAPAARQPASVALPGYTGNVGRDPFIPLVVPPVATPSPAATASGSASGALSGSGAAAVVSAVPSGVPATATPAPQTRSVSLYLVSVGGTTGVDVTVNGASFHVVDGQVFASDFQLLSAQNTSATFLFGDNEFVLTPGQFRTFS